jgi:hypothetical protein
VNGRITIKLDIFVFTEPRELKVTFTDPLIILDYEYNQISNPELTAMIPEHSGVTRNYLNIVGASAQILGYILASAHYVSLVIVFIFIMIKKGKGCLFILNGLNTI